MLVAIAIFAFVGVMALSGYTQLQKQTEYQHLRLERVREVQRAVQTLAQDGGFKIVEGEKARA